MSAPAVDTVASSAARSASQRAVRIEGPRDARVDRAPIPKPGPGQVLVRLEGSGVCASNIPVWQGRPWFDYPMEAGAPGHEGWGHVAALGPQVQGLETGQRVCLVSGKAYAEWDVADAAGVVPIPDIISHLPIPGEPLGCAMNSFRRAGIRAGDEVAIVGVGFLGALLVRLATNAGARVTAISRRPFSLDVARQCGAENTLPFGDPVEVELQVRD